MGKNLRTRIAQRFGGNSTMIDSPSHKLPAKEFQDTAGGTKRQLWRYQCCGKVSLVCAFIPDTATGTLFCPFCYLVDGSRHE